MWVWVMAVGSESATCYPLSLFCFLPLGKDAWCVSGWPCAQCPSHLPGSLEARCERVNISGHKASWSLWAEDFGKLLKGETAHLSWCLAFRGDGKCSSSHLDPKGTLTMEAMLGGWQSRHIKPSSWFTLYLFTRASFRWENCLSHIFCVFVFFILLANLILIDSDDEDYFFSEFKRSISLGILQRLHLFQLLSNWVICWSRPLG